MKTNKKTWENAQKRKRGAGFHCRKKYDRAGEEIDRLREYVILYDIKNHFTSS